jgi:hypothetical protein
MIELLQAIVHLSVIGEDEAVNLSYRHMWHYAGQEDQNHVAISIVSSEL